MKRTYLSLALCCSITCIIPAMAGPYYSPKEQGGGFPSSAPGGITGRVPEPAKSCREYLTTCERSCASRGDLFRFLCQGPAFNPDDQERYRCQCGDEIENFTTLH